VIASIEQPRPTRPSRGELLGLLGIVVLAAVLRLPGLDVRGAFDADQGHDMLVLAGILRGDIPLLGPPTSIGTFHHGAVYYYALAPAVLLFGPDPVAVTGWIALWGVGAVAATWCLGRLLGGPVAAVVAGLLLAISPAGIDSSTFIWNPNLIPCAAALAFAAAIYAWRARSARWWLLVAAGAMVTMQAHVLGVVVLPPLVVAYLADLRRAGREQRRRGVALAGVGALLIIALSYVPLAVHELQSDFGELRAIGSYVAGDGTGAASGLLDRLSIVAMRSVVWPFAGLVSADPLRSLAALLLVVVCAVIAVTRGRAPERRGVGFVLASVGWAVLALAVAAPSLAVIVPSLPNDHYHAFLDPLLIGVVGAGIARLDGSGAAARDAARGRWAGALAAGALLVGFAVIAVSAWPPLQSPDGGWQAAERDAATIETLAGGAPYVLVGIPPFKTTNAVRFPLAQLGSTPGTPDDLTMSNMPLIVFVCDPVFEEVVGAPCGGPAEQAWLAERGLTLQQRAVVQGGARRVISSWASR
jgi:4-amino-4-deoxy-L-arabinose transferase-like glycosyltransferase